MSPPGNDAVLSADVALSLQTALLGEIGASLRGVCFSLSGSTVQVGFFYDREPSREERESASAVDAELLASLPEGWTTEVEVAVVPVPARLPDQGRWVYRRREPDRFVRE